MTNRTINSIRSASLLPALEANTCTFWADRGSIASSEISDKAGNIRFATGNQLQDRSLLVRPGRYASVARDMTYSYSMPGMAIDLSTSAAHPKMTNNLSVLRVRTIDARRLWGRIVGGDTVGEREVRIEASEQRQRYVALLNGSPVAASALVLDAGVAGIYCVRTLPRFRRQGLASLMTTIALFEAREHGYRIGVALASEAGVPLYQRLGFTTVCNYDIYLPARGRTEATTSV